jgi:hypothetical protein
MICFSSSLRKYAVSKFLGTSHTQQSAHTMVIIPSRTYNLVLRSIFDHHNSMFRTHHLQPAHPATPSMYKIPKAINPPNAPLSALAMNRYATLIPSSSLVYQLHRNSVMDGNKQPSKKPRKILVVTKPAKFCTKPVNKHTRPQQNVMVGITRLNCKRLTSSEVGNSARM